MYLRSEFQPLPEWVNQKIKIQGRRKFIFYVFLYGDSANANTLFGVLQLGHKGLRRLLLGGVPKWLFTPRLELLNLNMGWPCQIPFLTQGPRKSLLGPFQVCPVRAAWLVFCLVFCKIVVRSPTKSFMRVVMIPGMVTLCYANCSGHNAWMDRARDEVRKADL